MPRTLFALLLAAATSTSANAVFDNVPSGKYTLDKTHGYVTFSYSHLGFSHPTVGFNNLDATLDLNTETPSASKVSVTIDATSVDSQVEEYNGHLNDTNLFDTANFPTITFESTNIEKTGDDTYDVTGNLTIKGKTKPVTLATTINKAAKHPLQNVPAVGVSASTVVLRSDFGMDYAVPAVSDEVAIKIEVELHHQAD